MPSSRQHMRKFSHIEDVSPRTSLQRILPPIRLYKEDNQVHWQVAFRPQQVTLEDSIHVKLYGWTDSKLQASHSTSVSAWSFPRNHSILQKNDIWEGSKDVQLYCRQASNFQASNAIYGQHITWEESLAPQQGTWAESNDASTFQASNASSGSACIWFLSFQGYMSLLIWIRILILSRQSLDSSTNLPIVNLTHHSFETRRGSSHPSVMILNPT